MAIHICNISSVSPGMRLARSVGPGDGLSAYEAGSVVTETMLHELRGAGVLHLAIELNEAEIASQIKAIPEEVQEQAKAAVADDFTLLPMKRPIIAGMYAIALERQSRAILSKAKRSGPVKKSVPGFQTQRPEPVNIRRLISAGQKIGTLPMIFHRLVEIINNPAASAADAAKVVAADPSLCAKLLRLVNSPLYGLPTRIDTIPRAVVLVGTGQLVMLAMGTTLITAFKGIPVSLISMQTFWSHSLACGVASRQLARMKDIPLPDGFFVAGLLHDISRLIIYTQIPAHALHLMTEARRQGVSVSSLEREILGFTHEELGGELLRSWSCPEDLVRRVESHHHHGNTASMEDVIIPVANLLTQCFGFGSSGEVHPDPLDDRVWEMLSLTPDDLPDFTRKMDDAVRDLRSVLTTPG